MKLLLPLLLTPLATLQRTRLLGADAAAMPEVPSPPRHDEAAPDWRHAYLRLREEEPAPPTPLLPTPAVLTAAPDTPPPTPPQVTPLTPTAARIVEAVRQIAEPAPALAPDARVWQVELPASGPAWQLRIEQAQPQAPLKLELRVPAVQQLQARQQLVDLDRRLREAGHDVARLRCRTATRQNTRPGPIDEVPS